ncbi:bifunctional diguanylate cyclase/phosphodiesterase [Methylobacillus gramineus]|uniref:putative bifunctional diguanylate cyclase/phosphodiesterase n=1 Tax=Methylobacillus gramineus TaxID=755169 RepID=UPI001D0013D1|nr:bifunctional diguanylate cyclase/phosphodiesterase [Methylobacillus gramineus]MCB5184722.1 bifunctional diguanylate cyclase/phosphodiesterase [Methylobacillus gramineus]
MVGSYDYRLVLLSIFIAFISSLTAFMFAARVARNQAMIAKAWLVLGAIAMGSGIWAMHFINMLALSLPTPMGYSLDDTVLSWLIAVSISWLALDIASRPQISRHMLYAAGSIMGLGIIGMHYTGMHAMHMFPEITYNHPVLALSLVISIGASILALLMIFHMHSQHGKNRTAAQLLAATVMTAGIVGAHFSGMAAAKFHPHAVCASISTLPPTLLAIIIALGATALILLAAILALMDSRNDHGSNLMQSDTTNKLSKMAMLDSLTQLPNKRYFQKHLDIGIRRTTRLGNALAVALIKLDQFNSINQSLGQHIGDEVLKATAKRLQNAIRGCDMVAYQGSEEFLVLFEDISTESDIAPVMQRIMQALSVPLSIDHHELSLSASAGIAMYPKHGDPERLLTYAEAAMHRAQAVGRHHFRFFDARIESSSYDLLETQQDLYHALERNEFALYFEPRVDSVSNQITSLEVLAKWQHPSKGAIPAATFMPMAESLGLLEPITSWILAETCRVLHELRVRGINQKATVPLTAAQLHHPEFHTELEGLLATFSLLADALVLEIPESVFMQKPEQYGDLIRNMPAVSLKISLENFGTSFSSLQYLQNLKLKELKLDQSFTEDLVSNQRARAIVGAIIELTQAHGLKVIAEKIRTEEQRQILSDLHCNQIQGFLVANPVHEQKLASLLKHSSDTSIAKKISPAPWVEDSSIYSTAR